jgi:hypothetical protein
MEKNMKKLYLTKVNPFAQAKWQNKKKKKTNASPISGMRSADHQNAFDRDCELAYYSNVSC